MKTSLIRKSLRTGATIAIIGVSGLGLVPAAVSLGAENPPMLSSPKVAVSKQGAVTAKGMVDCSAEVLARWPGYVGAPDSVLTNVSWTASQRKGRTVLSATFQDSQASPCWAKPDAPFVEPDRCEENADGTLHPCIWDSKLYGSEGWVFGSGVFKTGTVHLSATMDGGYYFVPGEPEDLNLGLFQIQEWDVTATRG